MRSSAHAELDAPLIARTAWVRHGVGVLALSSVGALLTAAVYTGAWVGGAGPLVRWAGWLAPVWSVAGLAGVFLIELGVRAGWARWALRLAFALGVLALLAGPSRLGRLSAPAQVLALAPVLAAIAVAVDRAGGRVAVWGAALLCAASASAPAASLLADAGVGQQPGQAFALTTYGFWLAGHAVLVAALLATRARLRP